MQLYNQAPSIHIRNAHLAFRDVVLFDQLNLTLTGGKCTCLLGPSGIGKSTLLRLIAGLMTTETASQEKTLIRAEISCDNDLPLSKQIAYMAQMDLLLPWLTVLDNIVIGSRLRHEPRTTRILLTEQAKELLHIVGLEKALELYPRQLSGGMRQRVALVRTIIENKPIVLMDEPFSALDTITRYKLQTMAADLLRNRTVLFITHDPLEALRLADEIFIMSGQPAQLDSPLELNTPTPRDLGEPRLLELQAKLLHELTSSYEAGV
jgi:putative hydroxymethylpyrimidine transport system ATP-binding protein